MLYKNKQQLLRSYKMIWVKILKTTSRFISRVKKTRIVCLSEWNSNMMIKSMTWRTNWMNSSLNSKNRSKIIKAITRWGMSSIPIFRRILKNSLKTWKKIISIKWVNWNKIMKAFYKRVQISLNNWEPSLKIELWIMNSHNNKHWNKKMICSTEWNNNMRRRSMNSNRS